MTSRLTALRRWLGRRRPVAPLDRIGPATVYANRLGAHSPRPAGWNGPTDTFPSCDPLMTRGQRSGYRVR